MTFEEDEMDTAYKSLEATEKFCDTSRKFSQLFSSGSQSQRLTPHQRLYRKSIIADCLLFEAILVFIRQSLTSYVKGGYLIRKAWKLYEKIYNETERLCSQPSPISRPDMVSPVDKHVGFSVYDEKSLPAAEEGVEEEEVEEGEKGEEEGEEVKENLAALGGALAQLGLGVDIGGGGEVGEGEGEGEREGGEGKGEGGGEGKGEPIVNGSKFSSSSSLSHSPNETPSLPETAGS